MKNATSGSTSTSSGQRETEAQAAVNQVVR